MAEEEAGQPVSPDSPTKPHSPLHLMLSNIADERKKFLFGQTDSGWHQMLPCYLEMHGFSIVSY